MLAITLASPPHFGQTETSMPPIAPTAPTFGKYPFQAQCPGHGRVPLFGCFIFVFLVGTALAAFSRRHIYPVFAVGREYAVEPG